MRHAHDPPSTLTNAVRKDRWLGQHPLSLFHAMELGAYAMGLDLVHLAMALGANTEIGSVAWHVSFPLVEFSVSLYALEYPQSNGRNNCGCLPRE